MIQVKNCLSSSFWGPSEPENLTATPYSGQLQLTWEEPKSANGDIDYYKLSWKRTDGKGSESSHTFKNDGRELNYSIPIASLDGGYQYQFEVKVSWKCWLLYCMYAYLKKFLYKLRFFSCIPTHSMYYDIT